jgi:hypothetical protein
MKGNKIPRELYTIWEIAEYLKREAMLLGKFPRESFTIYHYDNRYKLSIKPFRCIAYNEMVRRINRLEKVIKKMEQAYRTK